MNATAQVARMALACLTLVGVASSSSAQALFVLIRSVSTSGWAFMSLTNSTRPVTLPEGPHIWCLTCADTQRAFAIADALGGFARLGHLKTDRLHRRKQGIRTFYPDATPDTSGTQQCKNGWALN